MVGGVRVPAGCGTIWRLGACVAAVDAAGDAELAEGTDGNNASSGKPLGEFVIPCSGRSVCRREAGSIARMYVCTQRDEVLDKSNGRAGHVARDKKRT